MKKHYILFSFLSIILLGFTFSGNVFAQNLLTNGDMELWEADTLAGWDIHQAEIEFAQETSIVYEGSSSVKVTVNGDRGGTDLGQTGIIIQDGVTYDFSCWVYNPDTTLFFAWVIGGGPGDFTFSSSSGIHSDQHVVGEWTNFTWQWTNENAQYDTVYIFYRFYKVENGSQVPEVVYIDDATVMVSTASDDASLSDLTIEGGTVADFDAGVMHYDVDLPAGIVDVPTVDAVVNDPNASYVVTAATDLMGDEAERTTSVVVTAEDGTTTEVYTITFTVITGLDNQNQNKILLYPNPAQRQFAIEGLSLQTHELAILDVTGKIIRKVAITGEKMNIDISDLRSGYYFIKVEDKAFKLIKR